MVSSTGETELHLKPICHNGSSFQDHSEAKKKNPSKSDNVDSFQDPSPKQKKSVMFKDDPLVFPSVLFREGANKTSDPTSSTSHSSHQIQHFSPHSPSSSPPGTALIQRETSESLCRGPHSTKASSFHPTSRHVDTQLTTGLAALVQETSPLAPYKIQHSAKRKARQAFSIMC